MNNWNNPHVRQNQGVQNQIGWIQVPPMQQQQPQQLRYEPDWCDEYPRNVLNQLPFDELNVVSQLEQLLDGEPARVLADDQILEHFSLWYHGILNADWPDYRTWVAINVAMMTKTQYEFTDWCRRERGEDMRGVYRRAAYKRMQNWMSLFDETKNDFLQNCYNLRIPKRPQILNPNALLQPRAEHPWLEITESSAKEYLDRERTEGDPQGIIRNFNNRLNGVLRNLAHYPGYSAGLLHWIAANIGGMNTDDFSQIVNNTDRAVVRFDRHALRRMQNWMEMNSTWHEEFMNYAVIPIDREVLNGRVDDVQKFQESRAAHEVRIRRQHGFPDNAPVHTYVDHNLALNYLNNRFPHRFTENQKHHLLDIFRRTNPIHRRWLHDHVSFNTDGAQEQREQNWLTVHPTWREEFISVFYLDFVPYQCPVHLYCQCRPRMINN